MCCGFDEQHRKRGSIFQTHGTFFLFQEPTLHQHGIMIQLFKGPTLIRDLFYKIRLSLNSRNIDYRYFKNVTQLLKQVDGGNPN